MMPEMSKSVTMESSSCKPESERKLELTPSPTDSECITMEKRRLRLVPVLVQEQTLYAVEIRVVLLGPNGDARDHWDRLDIGCVRDIREARLRIAHQEQKPQEFEL